MKNLCVIFLIITVNLNAQEPKDDIFHYLGSSGLTAVTYSIPRNELKLPFWASSIISFSLNEIVGQLVENAKGNNYSKKDLRINRYGTLTGILTFELVKQRNKSNDLENQILKFSNSLLNLNKANSNFYCSIELNGKNL